ncbi:TPA: hypothetical protein NKP52_004554 [Vibrio parahaemolyticus]|uniref:hypothetical protein n=1 Tax=Vibrio harveyi group TaxID=717610 RepID=UPI001B824953|nr:hypothetical protein [Vibrio parahaemolyticus]HCH1106476.1 hypothetical protein [Vibrio parahaemolyticus]HCH1111720.1 hypothetical protein [Vibrio parahaemolyticus]
MGTKNITREQRSQLIGKLELIIHAVQPGTVISEEMAEIVIETLMETRGVIKKHPIQLNKL